jgi:hypothetical protein
MTKKYSAANGFHPFLEDVIKIFIQQIVFILNMLQSNMIIIVKN